MAVRMSALRAGRSLPPGRYLVLISVLFFLFVQWDFGHCDHYWPTVPASDDR
jgi:hypothetical protein